MNKQFEEIVSESKKVALTSEEKSRVRNFLLAFMGKHKKESLTRRAWNFLPMRFLLKPVYAVIFILLLGGTGTAFASEASLPGDFLYPVKTKVMEEVRGAFAFNEEQKAAWEVRRAERRMEEMKKLEEKGRLNSAVKSRIEENFQRHEEKINAVIRKLEEKQSPNAAAIKIRLQNSIEAHERILERFERTRPPAMKAPKIKPAENGTNKNNETGQTTASKNLNKPLLDNTSHNKSEQAGPKNK